jgi:hypothetical protein
MMRIFSMGNVCFVMALYDVCNSNAFCISSICHPKTNAAASPVLRPIP